MIKVAPLMRYVLVMFSLLMIITPTASLSVAEEPTLRIALPSPPQTLNVWSGTSSWTIIVLNFIYEPLATIGPESKYVPWLAESWNVSSDGKVWTIRLREGILWQDGKPLTAEDVKFTYEYFKKDPTARRGFSDMEYLDHIEVVDDYMFKMYLTEPFAAVVSTMLTNPIVPKHIWEPIVNNENFTASKYEPKISEVIGTGPYKIAEYRPDEYIRFTANENYWKGAPSVKNVVIRFVKEADTQVMMIKKGEIDVAIHLAINPAVEEDLKAAGVNVHRYLRPYFYHWGFNLQHFPFTEIKFRKAMAYAINLTEIIEIARLGAGEPGSYGIIPPVWKEWFCKEAAEMYTYDPDKARQLLDELNWIDRDGDGIRETPDGREIKFEIYPPSYDPARVRAAEMIRDYLKEIGVKAVVRVGDWKGVVWPGIKAHKLDSFILGSGTEPDPDFMRVRFKTNASANYYLLSDPEIDRLLEQQAITIDRSKRKEIVCNIERKLADVLPLITLYYPVIINPYRTDRFEGWVEVKFDWILNRYTLLNLRPKASTTVKTTYATTTLTKTEMGPPIISIAGVLIALIIIVLMILFSLRRS